MSLRPWTLGELSAASGQSPERLAWYADSGLLIREEADTFAADSVHRLQLIHHAQRRGISDDDLVAATRELGDLLGLFDNLAPEVVTSGTLRDAARAADVPEELFDEVVRLLELDAGQPPTEGDVEAMNLLSTAQRLDLPRDALLQLVRVYADLTERLADATVRTFHDHVHEQMRADGAAAGRTLLEATAEVARPMLALVEPSIQYFHRRAWEKANRDDFLRHLAEAATPPQARPGEAQAAVMFIDLAGFTPLTLALGDHGVAAVLQRFSALVRSRVAANGGRIIKQIGDAFMVVLDRPDDALRLGRDVMAAAADDAELPPLHIGAHWGMVLHREGDYVGTGVNTAARVASSTEAGQFLVTQALVDAATVDAAAGCVAQPPRTLKGLSEPVTVYDVPPPDA